VCQAGTQTLERRADSGVARRRGAHLDVRAASLGIRGFVLREDRLEVPSVSPS